MCDAGGSVGMHLLILAMRVAHLRRLVRDSPPFDVHGADSVDAPRKDGPCVGKRAVSCDCCGAAPDRKKPFLRGWDRETY